MSIRPVMLAARALGRTEPRHVHVKVEVEESEFPGEGNSDGLVAVLRLASDADAPVAMCIAGGAGGDVGGGRGADAAAEMTSFLRALLEPVLQFLRSKGIIGRPRRPPLDGLVFKLEHAAAVAASIERNARPVEVAGGAVVAVVRGADRVPIPTLQCLLKMTKVDATFREHSKSLQRHSETIAAPSATINDSREQQSRGGAAPADSTEFACTAMKSVPGALEVQKRYDAFRSRHREFARQLLPFQHEGVMYGLVRGGRVMIADEMGVGKTLQAVALSLCYREEWPVLIVVPASLRVQWAEEFEKWVGDIRPDDIKVIMSTADRIGTSTVRVPPDATGRGGDAARAAIPLVTITSYTMLVHLQEEFKLARFKVVVIDESHKIRGQNSQQNAVVERITSGARRIIMLTGTPCVSKPFDMYQQINILRPGMLGRTQNDFGRAYCDTYDATSAGGTGTCPQYGSHAFSRYNGGRRANELHLLLSRCVMIRRLKEDVGCSLPPLRRQIVQLEVPGADAVKMGTHGNEWRMKLALLKVKPVIEWLTEQLSSNPTVKFLVFGHHFSVMDAIQDLVLEKRRLQYIRIDGTTPSAERGDLVRTFRDNRDVRVALLSVTAAGVGLDFTVANVMVFVELPGDVATLRQAEDRTHRRGQSRPVNSYYLSARKSVEELQWRRLAVSLDAITAVQDSCAPGDECSGRRRELKVDSVISSVDGLGCVLAVGGNARGADCGSQVDEKGNEVVTSQRDRELTERNVNSEHHCLWIEVSRHTGRLHLHGDEDGSSPLGINFMLEQVVNTDPACAAPLPPLLAEDPLCLRLVRDFATEWQSLTSHTKKMMYGRLMRPPLCGAINRERIARLRNDESYDVHSALSTERLLVQRGDDSESGANGEPGVEWRSVSYEVHYTDALRHTRQAFDASGRRLCLYCSAPYAVIDDTSEEVAWDEVLTARYQLFCNGGCHEQHLLRTNTGALRYAISRVEKGKCFQCGTDCMALVRKLKSIRGSTETEVLRARMQVVKEMAPQFLREKNENRLRRLIRLPCEAHAWEADHTIAVHNGGGNCGTENVHVLCSICHSEKSALEAAERAQERKRRKRALM